MVADKSLSYYGGVYHRLMDPLIRSAREVVIARIPEGSSVLDVGCGTGLLCHELRSRKGCQVVGIDLSQRMLEFARNNNPYNDIEFLHQDATNMEDLQDDAFEFVVILNVIHELMVEEQLKVLGEAFRVGERVLIYDTCAPLPWNPSGVVKRLIEATFGNDHYPQFRSYRERGGIMGILERAGKLNNVEDSTFHGQRCFQLVQVSS